MGPLAELISAVGLANFGDEETAAGHGLFKEVALALPSSIYQTKPAGAWDGVIHCRVLEVVANRRLAYSWKGGHSSNDGQYGSKLDTTVTLTLESAPGGTRLRIVHAGFLVPRNDAAYRGMSEGWSKVVKSIGTIANEESRSTDNGEE